MAKRRKEELDAVVSVAPVPESEKKYARKLKCAILNEDGSVSVNVSFYSSEREARKDWDDFVKEALSEASREPSVRARSLSTGAGGG
jgi:hypothetical protein